MFASNELAINMMLGGCMPGFMAFHNRVGQELAREAWEHKLLAEHSHTGRMTTKTPQMQQADYHAAEAKRARRALRNLRNAGLDTSEAGESELL